MVLAANRDSHFRNDEILTKVLSAAYSLQQQHDRVQSKLPAARFSIILAEVTNTQALIREQKLDPVNALQLIASRTERLVGAAGAAIAVLHGEVLEYPVGTGIAAALCGFKAHAQDIISFERLRSEPLAQMDSWQDKVIGGRVGGNVLSAPVYIRGILGGCVQLFSRHGHFNFDGGYVCELMSGIVSRVIENIPAADETRSSVPVERASRRDEHPCNPTARAASTREKPEWPGSNTRELEARLKKAATSAHTAEAERKAIAAGESIKFSPLWPRTSRHQSDDAKRQQTFSIRDKQEGQDRNPQVVSRGSQEARPSHGSLALVPSEAHPPQLVPSPSTERDKCITQKTWREDGREPQPDTSDVVLFQQPPANSQVANDKEATPRSKNWRRMSRLIYPIFVLLFAAGVRIRAGAHNWALEVIIYVLLVLTTLELRSRWTKG